MTKKQQKIALFSSVAALIAFGAQPAVSQTADDDNDTIVVTGSRIHQNPLNMPNPIQNITSEDVDRTGLTSIADVLQRLPVTGSAINTTNNSSGNLGFPPDGSGIGAGASQIDLRNLSAKRTLVLVDGKRWINGSSASGVPGSVDLNTIPAGIISRVEILQDGASPIYGSDAIAGVVNIITRTDFEGFRANGYYGSFGQGDGETQNYEASFGASSEKTRVLFDMSYTRQKDVAAGDRKISEFPIAGAGKCLATCSSGTPQSRLFFVDPNTGVTHDITLNNGALNDGNTLPVYDPLNPTGGDFHAFTVADRFNFQPFNFIQTPNKRLNLFAKAEHDVTENITLRLVGSYTNRQSQNRAAPEPLFIGPEAGNGNIMDTIGIDVTNPFNPFGFSLDANNFVFAGRRPIEAGPRLFKQNVDTWFAGATLDGKVNLAGRDIYWDANASFSQAQANQRKTGAFNAAKLKRALGPLDQCIDPATGAGIDGCTPFNYLGGQGPDGSGSITQEMLDFVTFVQKDESQQQQFDFTFNVTGDLIDLPAGPVGFAAGFERRHQEGFFIPDAVVTAGETAGVPSSPTSGGFNVSEFYGEINVPLLADLPFMQKLSFSGAVRSSDYNLFGTNQVYKAGGNWRVNDDLLLRGSWSEGFRAPGIGELFNTGSRFDSTLEDPCSDLLGLAPQGTGVARSAQTIANCGALGVPTDGSYVQFGAQIGVQTGGNTALQPETSNSYNFGFVYDASWAENMPGVSALVFEADYYHIKINGAIQPPDPQTKLNSCVATLDPVLCSGINRTASGTINGFNSLLSNIGGITTSGFDWSVKLALEENALGQFSFQWLNTYLDKYNERVPTSTGFASIKRDGFELGSPERGFNHYKSTFITDWAKGDFGGAVSVRYLSKLNEACPGSIVALAPDLCTDATGGTNIIGSKFYTDIQASWSPQDLFGRETKITVGVNNVLDSSTPVCFTCDLNSFDGTLYPIPGQFFYARFAIRG
jgi:iron complex outermembrane recepter protein